MTLERFAESRPLSLGVELELQLVSTHDYNLTAAAEDMLRLLGKRTLPGEVKPEMTSSMLEISTGVCERYGEVDAQLTELRDALAETARRLNIGVCGGGTHGFQRWDQQRIVDRPRFHHLSSLYGYLAKQFTVFGQHVHIGCPAPDVALFLLHSLSRYLSHFIALSASSPFVQGVDTGFDSARLNSVFAFPLSGRAPFVECWADFQTYFAKMTATGVVESMKDFYWDIRPKPEFGTVEVRVMDTPLTVGLAAQIAAYIQAVSRYIIIERPQRPQEDDYLVYSFNRFQACRFGYGGTYVDPRSHEQCSIGEDILATLKRIEQHAIELKADSACATLAQRVREGINDAALLRADRETSGALPEVARRQCLRWAE